MGLLDYKSHLTMNFIIASFFLLSLVSFGEPSVAPEFWTPDCSSDSDCTKWAVEAGKVDSDYCCAKQKCGDSEGCRENVCIERSKDRNLDCPSNSHWTPLQASAGLKRKRRQPKQKQCRGPRNSLCWKRKRNQCRRQGGWWDDLDCYGII